MGAPVVQRGPFALVHFQQDVGVPGDVRERWRRGLQQRVAGRRPQLAPRPHQHLVAEPVALVHVGQQRHPQLDFAAGHRLFDLGPVQVHQVQHHVGVAPAKTRQQVGQEVAQHGVGRRDPHRAAQRIALKARLAQRVVQGIQHVAGALVKVVAFGSQRDAVGMAVEQAHAQLCFQCQHRVGDGRLRDVLVGRRHGEPARPGGGGEVAQLPQGDIVSHVFIEYQLPEYMNIR
ncbi:hypothetical protein D3C85_1246590 [compost metagenome]